jgi:hypothetical protein
MRINAHNRTTDKSIVTYLHKGIYSTVKGMMNAETWVNLEKCQVKQTRQEMTHVMRFPFI